jgi:metallo-beta-lactamase family protein
MAEAFLTCWSGTGLVTGSNFMLEAEGKRVLVDCGLIQDGSDSDQANALPFPYPPSSIDVLFVTHAHMDHVGRIPKLVHDGFRGVIYSTPETKALARLMLDDAASVFADHYRRRQDIPLYRASDVVASFDLWKELPYHEPLPLAHGFTVQFLDAGHILGSAMVEFTVLGEKIVFTGDLGNSPSPLLRDTEELDGVRYLLMESVYGDRNHEGREERQAKLAQAVRDIAQRKGTLIVPAFSLERTQILLSELNELIEGGKVPLVPVFLDSPLAIRVTDVYHRMRENWNDTAKMRIASGDEPFLFPKLSFTSGHADSEQIQKVHGAKIVIAGSGMSTGGRITGHEKRYLPHPENIMLLVGYQSLGTPGRRISSGAKEVIIDGERIPIRAEVRSIEGYSSHKGLDDLVRFVETTADSLETVFVAMGEPKSSLFLVQRLRDYLGVDALYPQVKTRYRLSLDAKNK